MRALPLVLALVLASAGQAAAAERITSFTSEVAVREVTKPVLFHPQFEGCVPFPSGELR